MRNFIDSLAEYEAKLWSDLPGEMLASKRGCENPTLEQPLIRL
jgi:hypothetical protein